MSGPVAIATGALTPIGAYKMRLDLNNGAGPVTATGKGPWLPNPFKDIATVHFHLMETPGSGSAAVNVEGSNSPEFGDGGPAILFKSDPAGTAPWSPGALTDNDTGDLGTFQHSPGWIRYNCYALAGTLPKIYPYLVGDQR